MKFEVKAISLIHSPYKSAIDVPKSMTDLKNISQIEVYYEYKEGLKDIEGFSHILVIYLFHQSTDYSLIVNTPWDDVPHGVFATRSPKRPNPIGLTVVHLVREERETYLR
jgi:tRNA-Thr(GGU) m(6)t(6)A37 methyltransferase TsaA